MPSKMGNMGHQIFPGFIFATLCIVASFSFSLAQQSVNVLFFYEDSAAIKIFDAALAYVKKDLSDQVTVDTVYKVNSIGNDAPKLIQTLCSNIDSAFANAPEKHPDIAIDFTRKGIPSESVKLLLKLMNLPTISGTYGQEGDIRSWRDLTDTMKNYLIQIAPPADMVPQIMRSVVAYQEMANAVLLFDDEYEMYHKYKSLLQNKPTRHLLTKLETSKQRIRRQIDRLVHLDLTNFFIAASPEEISGTLAEASDPEMRDGPYFNKEFSWHSMSMEPGLPRCSACKSNVSIVHFSPKINPGNERVNFLKSEKIITKRLKIMPFFYFDLTINAILAMAKLKREGKWPDEKWKSERQRCRDIQAPKDSHALPLFDALNSDEVHKNNILGKFHLDSNKTVGKSHALFEMNIERLTFEEFESNPTTQKSLGTWTTGFLENELISTNKEEVWKDHKALTVFRIVTKVQEPFIYKKANCVDSNKYDKFNKCFYGYCIDLLEKIREKLKFNYTIYNVDEYGYMQEEVPYEWDGIMREILDRRADIAIGAIQTMPERETVVDFTTPFYEPVGISVLMKKPKIPTSLFKFLTVLENDVWLCILGAYFFTSFLMWVFDRWSPYSYQNNREKYEEDEEKREFNLKECLWFCMTSLTPQGGGEAPKNLSGRLVAATWWLFGFIIIASYTANLAAFLTVSRLDAPIESLDDLARQYKIQYAPQKDSAAWKYFDRMAHVEHRFYEIWKDMSLNDSMDDYERSQLAVWDYPVSDKFTKMWQAMQENNPPIEFETAVKRVRGRPDSNDGFAFLGDATDIRYQVLISCDFKMVGEEFSLKPYAWAVQKGSPLKEQINHILLKMMSQRELERLKEMWWNENPHRAHCPVDLNQGDGISIHNIGGVFIVIFAGIILTLITITIEYCWYSHRRNKTRNVDDMGLPGAKDFAPTFSTEKTNFNTQYAKPPTTDLPSIDTTW